MVNIYTDGSARGNPGPGGWGAIIAYEDRVQELGGGEDYTTNNKMELTAVMHALWDLEGEEAVIHTDSEYVMKGMTQWIEGWQKRGWMTAAKKPVLNQELWQALLKASEGKKLEWKYVAGHSGHEANERCDEIATSFADRFVPELYNGPRDEYKVSLK